MICRPTAIGISSGRKSRCLAPSLRTPIPQRWTCRSPEGVVPIELTAVRSLHPGQIDLRWRWSSRNAARPDFRVVRQSGGPAAAIADGRLILRLSDWYSAAGPAWGRVERLGFLIDRSAAEGGLEQASLELYFTAPGDAEPARVIVQFYDATTSAMQRVEILDVTSVNRTQVQVLPTDPVTHKWEIFHTSGGVPVSAGVVSWTISMPSVAPPTDKFTWTGAASTLVFERFASRVVRRENTNPVTFVSVVGTQTVPFLTILEATNLDTGEFSWDVQFTDDKLTAPAVRYYTLFVPDTSQPSGFLTATATALPGTDFDSPNRLYELLPPFHRYADEPDPAPAARGKGQLRSFLVPFGLAIDAARSGAERLRDTLDPVAARAGERSGCSGNPTGTGDGRSGGNGSAASIRPRSSRVWVRPTIRPTLPPSRNHRPRCRMAPRSGCFGAATGVADGRSGRGRLRGARAARGRSSSRITRRPIGVPRRGY